MNSAPPTERPRRRADCENAARPCPHRWCRYNLVPELKPGAPLLESCALDVADRGEVAREGVAQILGFTRSRIAQIEERALEKLRDSGVTGFLGGP